MHIGWGKDGGSENETEDQDIFVGRYLRDYSIGKLGEEPVG